MQTHCQLYKFNDIKHSKTMEFYHAYRIAIESMTFPTLASIVLAFLIDRNSPSFRAFLVNTSKMSCHVGSLVAILISDHSLFQSHRIVTDKPTTISWKICATILQLYFLLFTLMPGKIVRSLTQPFKVGTFLSKIAMMDAVAFEESS